MNRKLAFLSVLLLICFALQTARGVQAYDTDSPIAADPFEPNNSRAAAALIPIAEYIEATIDPLTDVDFYRFEVLAGQKLGPELNVQSGAPLMLAVLDGGGALLASADMCAGGNFTQLDLTLMTSGVYYARVKPCPGATTTTAYGLELAWVGRIEVEPNDTRATATPLLGRVEATIGSPADVDFFSFTGARNEAITFNAEGDGDSVWPHLVVQNAGGTVLAEATATNPYAQVTVVLPAAGTYFLAVRTDHLAGDYHIQQSPGQAPDNEPNDSPGGAGLIGYNTRGTGTFGSLTDVDYYKFAGRAGDRIQFGDGDGCAARDNSWQITLLDATQKALGAAGNPASRVFTLPADGTYYLKVNYLPGAQLDDNPSQRYALTLILADPTEPDESVQAAQPIAYGQEKTGVLDPGLDKDWYRFTGRAGDMVNFSLRPPRDGDRSGLMLALYDANMNFLIGDGTTDWGLAIINYLLPADGTYILVVDDGDYCYDYHAGGGGYRLSVQKTHSLYVSALVDGLGGNAAIKKGDIATRNANTGAWELVFDASDVGITQNVFAFEWTSAGNLLMALQAAQTVPGLGTVNPTDILRFAPTSLGATTAGAFSFYMRGADVGLTTSGEKIDAISWVEPYPTPGSRLLVSTTGSGRAPRTGGGEVAFADEDLLAFDQTSASQPVKGTWQMYMDGSPIPGMAVEDLGAATAAPRPYTVWDNGPAQLAAFPGSWTIDSVAGGPRDLLRLEIEYLQSQVSPQARNLVSKAIDALSLGPLWPIR